MRLKPDNGLYYTVLAGIHFDRDEYTDALAEIEKGLALKPDSQILQRRRAIALAGVGRGEEAKQVIQKFIDENPQKTGPRLAMGKVHLLLKEYEACEVSCREALKLAADNVGGHAILGLLYFEWGKADQARPFLEEALRMNPYIGKVKRALAELHANAPPLPAIKPTEHLK